MDKGAELDKLTRHPARLEALLAEMLESRKINRDGYMIRPRSLFKRPYSHDVLGWEIITPKHDKKRDAELLVLDVSREGFYDAMPEFFFHTPEVASGYKNLDQRLKESEIVKQEEAAARLFFWPFEQEFFRAYLSIEQEERRFLSGFSNPMQRSLFERFWTDVQGIPQEYESVLFYLLPLAYKISGNREAMAACFETVLQIPVHLKDYWSAPKTLDPDQIPGLGDCELGVDMVVSGKLEEDLPDLRVFVGPIELDILPDFLEGGTRFNLLNLLYNYFVPAEMEIETRILLKQPEMGFFINNEPATARLGYSTYI